MSTAIVKNKTYLVLSFSFSFVSFFLFSRDSLLPRLVLFFFFCVIPPHTCDAMTQSISTITRTKIVSFSCACVYACTFYRHTCKYRYNKHKRPMLVLHLIVEVLIHEGSCLCAKACIVRINQLSDKSDIFLPAVSSIPGSRPIPEKDLSTVWKQPR